MDSGNWPEVFYKIKRKGVLIDEKILQENFQDVVNKEFDLDMGIGYISENGFKPKSRVVLQGRNPFIDNHTGFLSPVLRDFLPYSQVYHLAWGGEAVDVGRTFYILRHYLDISGMTEEELASIRVATSSQDSLDTTKYKLERKVEGEMEMKKKISVKEEVIKENTTVTVTKEVITQEHKKSVTYSENGKTVDRKPLKKSSTQALLEQMNQLVLPVADTATTACVVPGEVVITVHKATNIEKKGLVGKADPYVVLKYGTQKEKSATVNNNHNPVWHFTASFQVDAQSSNEITIEVFDDDIGKDDFLGKAIIDIRKICEEKEFLNKNIPLEKCKSGQLLVSAKFIPLKRINRPVGHVSLTVHKAKKIEKKNLIKKADPYVVIKLGKDKFKSQTVSNSHNPTWNHKVSFDVIESSPRQISFEVFDDDIGNDATLGNVTLNIATLTKNLKMDNLWMPLENCKSGELLISTVFTPAPVEEEVVENNTAINIKQEVVTEQFEEKKVQKKSMEVQNSPLDKKSINTTGSQHQEIEFVTPVYCDNEFVVVEKNGSSWFMVVSPHPNLPINVNLVPFKQTSDKDSPIYIYPLPRGGFHNIKRVVHSGKGLRKCGYEKHCHLRSGEAYQVWSKTHQLGTVSTSTWGPDMSWVVYTPQDTENYIEISVKQEANKETVFSGAVELYDTLNVEAA